MGFWLKNPFHSPIRCCPFCSKRFWTIWRGWGEWGKLQQRIAERNGWGFGGKIRFIRPSVVVPLATSDFGGFGGVGVIEFNHETYGLDSSHLKWSQLSDLCVQPGGVQTGPFGSQLHKKDYVPIGTPIITVEHLNDNRITHEDVPRVSDKDRERLKKYWLQTGDIVFSRVGSVDRRALVRNAENGWLFSGRCLRVRPDPNKLDAAYLSYFFGLPAFKEYINRVAVGATMPSLNTKILSDILIPFPPLPTQRRIAQILGRLDDKIELNRRLNRTLEAMAQALFKHHFVDFGPYQDGEFVESELGLIPRGWEVGTLGDVCHKPQYGYTASAQEEKVGPQFLRIKDINKQPWIDWSTVPFCEISEVDREKYRLVKGDFLIARMADPGHGVLIEEDLDAVFASYLIRFRPLDDRMARYLQYWQRSSVYWDLIEGRESGTTRFSLNAKDLSRFPLLVPPISLCDQFSRYVTSIREKVITNVNENRKLAEIRDYLLPKLLRGEIGVTTSD
jgi:type I restriction enzyme S subunit